MTCIGISNIIINGVGDFATLGIFCTALWGLSTWKKQKNADEDIYLRRNLMKAWVNLQGAVRDWRSDHRVRMKLPALPLVKKEKEAMKE